MKFSLKTNDEDERPVYITGNFNAWNPRDPYYKLSSKNDEHYIIIDDEDLPHNIEYKYTKGGWENVELDQKNNITANRKVNKNQKNANDFAEKWRKNWGPFKDEYFPIVELIDDDFYIPQLDKTRRIWALLPYNYANSTESYPVLYLQDAQNLFNEESTFGNWEIDKKLALLAEYGRGNLIVIAVEHGDGDRIKEYIFDNELVTEDAEGKKYLRFITDTLKPFVDQKYRTKKDRDNTGIGGSSLGGLISIYAGFLYPEVYSKLMIFSPSLWVEPNNNFPLMRFGKAFYTKVYLYGGEKEGSEMVDRIQKFESALQHWEMQDYFDFEVKTSINIEGTHQEFYWSQEFPRAIEWLYYDSLEDPLKIKQLQEEQINHD